MEFLSYQNHLYEHRERGGAQDQYLDLLEYVLDKDDHNETDEYLALQIPLFRE